MDAVLNVALAVGGALAVVYGVTCIAANYVMLYRSARNQRRGDPERYSLVPVVGPLVLSLIWLNVTTVPGTLRWVPLVPWIVDPGTWVLVLDICVRVKRALRGVT